MELHRILSSNIFYAAELSAAADGGLVYTGYCSVTGLLLVSYCSATAFAV